MAKRRNQYIFSNQKRRKRAAARRIIIILLVIAALAFALVWFLGKRGANIQDEIENQKAEEEGPEIVMEESADTEPPVITINKDNIHILEGADFDPMTNIEAKDDSGEKVDVSLDGEIDSNAPGVQTIKITATDGAGNTSEKEMTVNVIAIEENMPDMDFETPTGHSATIRDGILRVDDILVVNKSFSVPESYGNGMDPEAQEAFYRLADAASDEGLYIDINTGYRSYNQQSNLFWYYAETLGEGIDTMSSIMPGHSEHQTGLAMDINSTSFEFANSVEGIWLNNHCQEYGFIIRYPEDKEEITGYRWEPWHIRYVGKELAEKLYNGGDWITLEEYFGLPSAYPEN